MSLEPTTNFRDSNGVDLGSKLITKDYLISVYPSIGEQIGIPPELWVWGNGNSGRLGNNSTTNRSVPITTSSGGSNWKQVSSGGSHTEAIKTDGTLWVWGNNISGQLGTIDTTNRSTPVTTFAGGTDWKQINAGGTHSTAIKTDGTLWTWGDNSSGQLGKGTELNPYSAASTPIQTFAGGTNWADTATTEPEDLYTISAGNNTSTAIKTDGTLWTWGNGDLGQLGTNRTTTAPTPVTTFTGGTDWKQVSAGYHTAAIKTDGTLWTWGFGSSGQLGTNNLLDRLTPITTFAGGTNWADTATTEPEDLYTISAAGSASSGHVAAIKTDGTLWTWGYGAFGQLGVNGTAIRSTPVTTFAGGTNWKQVSVGNFSTTLAIKTDGTLWVWGNGSFAKLGTNNLTNRSTPVTTFAGGTDWKQASFGTNSVVAIKTDGTLWTWGLGNNGRLGIGDTLTRSTPVTTFAGGTDWKQVSINASYISAIKTDGTLWTWGSGGSRLGIGSLTDRSTPVTTFAGGTDWKQVSAGYNHMTAIKTDGTLWVWGTNTASQLGINVTVQPSTPVTTFAGGTDWKQVSGGTSHTAAIKTDGTLWTWGNGGSGGLGNSATTTISTPVTTFAGGTNWKQVSSGFNQTIALRDDGVNKELYVFGGNNTAQLGNLPVSYIQIPNKLTGDSTDWKQVSAGGNHTAAIKTDGTLWTWGNGGSGRLGNFATTNRSTPVTTFAGGTNWKQVSGGASHTAAIKTDGTLWSWGFGSFGRLGNSATTTRSTPVTTFAGGADWKQVSAGNTHTAAIKTDGTLWTWGSGSNGRLGNAVTTGNISTPVTTFAGGTNWKQVSSGYSHTAAIKTDGTLWTWGLTTVGRLGNAVTTGNISTPVTTFAGGTNWKQVSSGGSHTIALRDDGVNKELYVFGNNLSQQLGTNVFLEMYRSPGLIFGSSSDWKQINAGSTHSTAIKTDGTLWVWGNNTSAQLGTSDTQLKNTPVTTFAGGTNWKQTSGGGQHTSAIKTDGTLWSWGNGGSGTLGTNGTTLTRSTPVTTFAGGTDWKQVSSGDDHTTAIKTDGTLWTWGNGTNGRLGRISLAGTTSRSTPVTTFAGGTNWADTATGAAEELYTISGGSKTSLAVKTDGTLWVWGPFAGENNPILPNISTPVTTFAGGTNWKQVSGGYESNAAIKTDGTLWMWGFNPSGIHGANDNNTHFTPVTTFAGGTNWKQVSSGYRHTAAVKTDGTLWTWGGTDNTISSTGQLGRLSALSFRSTPVTTFAGGTNWADTATGAAEELYTISVGVRISAAIKTDGTLWTWGYGTNGSLGNGVIDFSNRSTPITTFAGGTNWKQVSIGQFKHGAGIKTDGTLWTWGFNRDGTLGNASIIDTSTPVTTFAGGTDWKQVSSGGYYIAAIKTDGTLWTWGYGGVGNLGNFSTSDCSTPVTTFAGGTDWKQVSSGYKHTAAVKTDGTLWTWGKGDDNGQLGNGYYIRASTPVTTFAGGTNWKQVSCGYQDTVAAIKTDGTLWMWGEGGLGNGGNAFGGVSTPVTTFAGGTNWKQVSTGGASATSAIKTDGTLWTWGYGGSGQLGTNDITPNRSTPVTTFAGGTNWKQVSANRSHIIALKDNGVNKELYVFGNNNSVQLGIPLTSRIPGQVNENSTDWNHVSAGAFYTAAIKTDGTLWTWGYGGSGQLGNNNVDDTQYTPITTFAGGTNWKQVSAAFSHTLAVKTDGTLWSWGYGAYGQLGTNDTTQRSTPTTTFAGGTNWKQVSCGRGHTSAVKTDGTLWTCGYGQSGRLGNADITNRFTPVTTFAGGTNWKQTSAGWFHTLALKDDGINKELYAFGANSNNQLGNNAINATIPDQVFGTFTNWKQVSAGNLHTSAIKTDGTLWTWGGNTTGQLGNAATTIRSTPVTTFAGGTNWKQISSGDSHTVAIRSVDF
jgi:alpha-tubulin suppressor-like RCC1 family protein